ncbi:MAG: GLPGLI family protein [Nonlabens sp.]|nr:GLPGLI family protein [Nonlabens sp.]
MKTFKYFFITNLFLVYYAFQSAEQKTDYAFGENTEVVYQISFNKFKDSKKRRVEYASLYVSNEKSIYVAPSVVKLDSIENARDLQVSDIMSNMIHDPYAISYSANSLQYFEKVGNEMYTYKETPKLEWVLAEGTKKILNYECKRANVDYGGRKWTAWFTTSLPLDVGPYKFKGLPGLILGISDDTNSFSFMAVGLSNNKKSNFKSAEAYIARTVKNEPIQTKKADFNKIKRYFHSLNGNERLNYMNKDKSVTLKGVSTNPETGERIQEQRFVRERLFIEI